MLQIFSDRQTIMPSWTDSSLGFCKLALIHEQNLKSKDLGLSAGFPNY